LTERRSGRLPDDASHDTVEPWAGRHRPGLSLPTTGLDALLQAAEAVQTYAGSKLAAIGLSLPKLHALAALWAAGDALPLTRMAERLSRTRSNITQLVDRLETDGLMTRVADPNDRRSRLAVLTPAGRTACEEGVRIQEQTERELLAGLDPDEAHCLQALMEKLQRRAS
jgi:DNA-binding MarR family transcriptional regulator